MRMKSREQNFVSKTDWMHSEEILSSTTTPCCGCTGSKQGKLKGYSNTGGLQFFKFEI